jgi:hypothetical protein
MTKDEAIKFLEKNQPLPSDDELSQEQINTFDNIRKYLIEEPDPIFIPLMLNAFGDGSGFGVYQVCDDVFRKFSKEQIISHLSLALQSPHWGVRYWASQWAMDFPEESLIPILAKLANDEHQDCHYFAISSLESIWSDTGNKDALKIISDQRNNYTDPELIELIDEILGEAYK